MAGAAGSYITPSSTQPPQAQPQTHASKSPLARLTGEQQQHHDEKKKDKEKKDEKENKDKKDKKLLKAQHQSRHDIRKFLRAMNPLSDN